jgi:ABC-type phosphate transport system permease subunit
MKALGIALGVLIALYLADQEFAQGQFTDAVRRIGAQMMHSFGI